MGVKKVSLASQTHWKTGRDVLSGWIILGRTSLIYGHINLAKIESFARTTSRLIVFRNSGEGDEVRGPNETTTKTRCHSYHLLPPSSTTIQEEINNTTSGRVWASKGNVLTKIWWSKQLKKYIHKRRSWLHSVTVSYAMPACPGRSGVDLQRRRSMRAAVPCACCC